MKTKIYFSLLILSFSLFSCSPQKRLHRLLALHPELVANDTIRIQDTTIIPQVNIDTIFHYNTLKDTLTITKEKFKIKLFQINDTIFLEAEVKADTIIITKEIPVEKVIHVKPKSIKEKLFGYFKDNFVKIFFVIIIISLAFRLTAKNK